MDRVILLGRDAGWRVNSFCILARELLDVLRIHVKVGDVWFIFLFLTSDLGTTLFDSLDAWIGCDFYWRLDRLPFLSDNAIIAIMYPVSNWRSLDVSGCEISVFAIGYLGLHDQCLSSICESQW